MDPTKKILLIRLKSIGDIVFTLPAVHALREAFPAARLSFLTSAENAPILEGFGEIDEVLTLERSAYRRFALKAMCGNLVRLLRKFRRERYSLVVDFQGYGETALFSWLTRAPQRWGRAHPGVRKRAYHRTVACNHRQHPALWNRTLLADCGLKLGALRNQFCLPDQAVTAAREFLRAHERDPAGPRLFIQPFTSSPQKNWPLPKFLDLARHCRAQGIDVAFGGGPREAEALAPARAAGFPVAAGASLLLAAGLIKFSSVTVGGDTGLLHLGVALGQRVVMLMETRAPGSATPLGHEDWAIIPSAGTPVASIESKTVIQACDAALHEWRPAVAAKL